MDATHDAVPGPIGHANGHPIAQPHGPAGDRLYVVVWAVLLVLTGVTVGVAMLDMKKFAVLAAMVIAGTKATLVLLYFMHP
ncbi:MAG: cytochrome C oxidase subunit IV family protein, partial [Deltaproteobacteria bacterium]|nr:cytochrome C oxidase subunit IV family protein [Deltaproteobacteria bacterium]